jgi:two-component system, chemotaxis family, protein-glutamate methylesterase/glutaminase
MRAMEEGTILMEHIAKQFEESGENKAAKIFRQKAKENAKRARVIHDSIFTTEQLSEDTKYTNEDIVKDKGYGLS